MKKTYGQIELEIISLLEDVIKTSQYDNVEDMFEFPESLDRG